MHLAEADIVVNVENIGSGLCFNLPCSTCPRDVLNLPPETLFHRTKITVTPDPLSSTSCFLPACVTHVPTPYMLSGSPDPSVHDLPYDSRGKSEDQVHVLLFALIYAEVKLSAHTKFITLLMS